MYNVMYLSWFFFIVCVSVCIGDAKVKYAAILFRHGDRTPVDMYPKDPWRNETFWPVKFGELTNIGKKQHYILGKWLRKRYSHLISNTFNPDEIYVRSTDVDRTLMSAQCNLAGMYPPNNASMWNPDLMWQPIPVHTVPEKEDNILAMEKPCPAYDLEMKQVLNSKTFKERLSKYQKLMDYLTKYTGRKVKTYEDIGSIYSNLHIENLYNFTLPEWTHTVFPDKLIEPSVNSFKVQTWTPSLARLKISPFVKEVVRHMEDVISNEKKHKHYHLSVFSGHDLTVANVLHGMGLFDDKLPDYTATVFIELLKDESSNYSVRVSYRNTPEIVEPTVLNIPNCGEMCPLDKFLKIYDHLINVDWNNECDKQFPAVLGMSFLVGLILFASIYVAHKVYFVRLNINNKVPDTTVLGEPFNTSCDLINCDDKSKLILGTKFPEVVLR